jgi:uncharacterized membrane protein
MKPILKIKTILGIIVAVIICILTIFDISQISTNTFNYIRVYSISPNSSHWMFRSVSNYTNWRVIQLVMCCIYICLSGLFLRSKSKILSKILLSIEIIVITLFIRSLYLWVASGYDHYPGYDPYIF